MTDFRISNIKESDLEKLGLSVTHQESKPELSIDFLDQNDQIRSKNGIVIYGGGGEDPFYEIATQAQFKDFVDQYNEIKKSGDPIQKLKLGHSIFEFDANKPGLLKNRKIKIIDNLISTKSYTQVDEQGQAIQGRYKIESPELKLNSKSFYSKTNPTVSLTTLTTISSDSPDVSYQVTLSRPVYASQKDLTILNHPVGSINIMYDSEFKIEKILIAFVDDGKKHHTILDLKTGKLFYRPSGTGKIIEREFSGDDKKKLEPILSILLKDPKKIFDNKTAKETAENILKEIEPNLDTKWKKYEPKIISHTDKPVAELQGVTHETKDEFGRVIEQFRNEKALLSTRPEYKIRSFLQEINFYPSNSRTDSIRFSQTAESTYTDDPSKLEGESFRCQLINLKGMKGLKINQSPVIEIRADNPIGEKIDIITKDRKIYSVLISKGISFKYESTLEDSKIVGQKMSKSEHASAEKLIIAIHNFAAGRSQQDLDELFKLVE